MARFDAIEWMTAEEDLWAVPEYLTTISYRPLLAPSLIRRLGRVDDRLYRAGRAGTSRLKLTSTGPAHAR
jgi:hypothetical protein